MLRGGNPRELGRYVALSQVGLMMAVLPGAGALLDSYFGWSPWGVIVGAVLGLTIGLIQLVRLANRANEEAGKPDEPKSK